MADDVEYHPLDMSPEDIQMLDTRVYGIQEIARWFNMPTPKLQEHSNSTYSNIAELERQFGMDTIAPWLKRWEQEVSRQLLTRLERRRLFAEHNMNALMRGDPETRNQAYAIMRQNGALSADEWRSLENMNPLGGRAGEIIWMPLNMTDAREKPEPIESKEPAIKEPEEEPEEVEEKQIKPLEYRLTG